MYARYEPCAVWSLEINLEFVGEHSWFYLDFSLVPDNNGSTDLMEKLLMLESNPEASLPIGWAATRDSLYDESEKYVIYDKSDVESLLKKLTEIASAGKKPRSV